MATIESDLANPGHAPTSVSVQVASVLVEKMGMDEVFVDVTRAVDLYMGTANHEHGKDGSRGPHEGFHGIVVGEPGQGETSIRLQWASQICRRVRRAILDRVGLTTSGGISTSKLLSKMVASRNKPDLQTVFVPTPHNLAVLMPPDLPVRKVSGIGRAAARRLSSIGITTIGELKGLQELPHGSTGSLSGTLQLAGDGSSEDHATPLSLEALKALASGVCNTPVVRSPPPKSVTAEDSFYGRILTTAAAVNPELKYVEF